MTYANMEKYIKVYENADELLEIFYDVREMSKNQKSPYKFVYDWFISQFPKYNEIPKAIDTKFRIIPKPIPSASNFDLKADKAS